MKIFTYILLLCILSCDNATPDIKGKWVAYQIGHSESSSSLFKEMFIEDRFKSIIYIDEKTIEYPFGFSGLRSLEFNSNFLYYSLSDEGLKIDDDEFRIQTINYDSICIAQNSQFFMCLNRVKESSYYAEVKEIKFSSRDEFFNADLKVNAEGKFSLKRSGLLSDSMTGTLDENDHEYLNVLANRVDFSKIESNYNPKASDVPNYSLGIVFGNSSEKVIHANGYWPMPDIPYSLSALLYNLDKLTRRENL